MSHQLTRREVRVLVVLPAVLLACMYAFIFERPKRAKVESIRQAAEVARQTVIPESELRARNGQIAVLKLPDRARAASRVGRNPFLVNPAGAVDFSGQSPQGLALISGVFDMHGLYILNTTHVPDATMNAMAPKSLQEFAMAVAAEGQSPIPEVWRIEMLGSYADVLAALGDLNHLSDFIVPLEMGMEPIPEETHYRRWTLWFWL